MSKRALLFFIVDPTITSLAVFLRTYVGAVVYDVIKHNKCESSPNKSINVIYNVMSHTFISFRPISTC